MQKKLLLKALWTLYVQVIIEETDKKIKQFHFVKNINVKLRNIDSLIAAKYHVFHKNELA